VSQSGVELVAEAGEEFSEAAGFYAGQRPGLGLRFVEAVERAFERVAAAPLAGAPLGGPYRRRLVVGFPYAVIYREDRSPVRVVAVAHLHRRPEYWRGRA
jgi:toxin ParE2